METSPFLPTLLCLHAPRGTGKSLFARALVEAYEQSHGGRRAAVPTSIAAPIKALAASLCGYTAEEIARQDVKAAPAPRGIGTGRVRDVIDRAGRVVREAWGPEVTAHALAANVACLDRHLPCPLGLVVVDDLRLEIEARALAQHAGAAWARVVILELRRSGITWTGGEYERPLPSDLLSPRLVLLPTLEHTPGALPCTQTGLWHPALQVLRELGLLAESEAGHG